MAAQGGYARGRRGQRTERASAANAKDPYAAMLEDGPGGLDDQVERIRKDFGTITVSYHPRYSEESLAGWPDRSYAGPGGLLYRELKRCGVTRKAKVSRAQWDVLSALALAGVDVAIWTPDDLRSGRITRELAVIARRPRRLPRLLMGASDVLMAPADPYDVEAHAAKLAELVALRRLVDEQLTGDDEYRAALAARLGASPWN
jgi:hypothetical protein